MVKPLFYVDLSEDARDYRHTALEPGLPLLDRQNVNFQILRKWLGDLIAEPEWRNADTVGFYMVDDQRGRLEDVDCHPVTRSELEKLFAKDLDAIRAKIKKIKPESSTEQMVHRILKKNIAEQAGDLEKSDFDSFFFKCRAGKEEWRLVWCCGYQRVDLEPLKARIWSTPDGDFLGVRPPLQGGRARRRKRTGPLDVLTSPWLVLALLLLVAGLLYYSWPRLEVTPADVAVPLGSQIEYRVHDRRWFLFDRDVTLEALAQAEDPRVVEMGPGTVAEAKSVGQTAIWFRVGQRPPVVAQVAVGPPEIPESLSIEPGNDLTLPIGSTRQLKAVGHYSGGRQVDVSRLVSWWEADNKGLLVVHPTEKGLIEGDSTGATQVVAQFPMAREDQTFVEASLGVQVVVADFTSLAITLQPQEFAVGQTSRVEVMGIDRDGQQHSLSGSSLLKLKVDPINLAAIDGPYLVGRAEGAGQLNVVYGELEKSAEFTIAGRALAEDVFLVSPARVDNAVVYELIPLNVTTGSDLPIEAVSADPEIVQVFRTGSENAGYEIWLAARRAGEVQVRVSQGSKAQDVQVVVTDGLISELEFRPPVYSLKAGEAKEANLVGTTQDGRLIKIAPGALSWERQPRLENVYLDKQNLLLRGLEPTEVPQPLRVTLGSTALTASATVEVTSGDLLALLDMENGFGVHPPVPVRGRYLDLGYLGSDLLAWDETRGGLFLDRNPDPSSPLAIVPRGSQLVELNGVDLSSMSRQELEAYLRAHRIGEGDVVRYLGPDGVLGTLLLGSEQMGVVRDFKLLDVLSTNITPDAFDADLRLYLRQPGEYRLTDSAGEPLSEWASYPQDSTPLMSVRGLARNADDDYELYVERRIGEQVRRFQVPFKLEPDRVPVVVQPIRVPAPEIGPSISVPPTGKPVITDDPDADRTRVKRTIRTIRRPASEDGTALESSVVSKLAVSGGSPTSPSAPSGASSPSPAAPPPASNPSATNPAAPDQPPPNQPAPNQPAPNQPAPNQPAPNQPAPNQPAPNQPPASQPAPNQPPTNKPAPNSPSPAAPALAKPDPARPPRSPASALPADRVQPAAPAAAVPSSVAGRPAAGREASRPKADDRNKTSPLLDALKSYNRDGR